MIKLYYNILLKFLSPSKKWIIYKKLGVNIGKNCTIFGEVSFGSEPYLVTLGDDVKITYGTQFVTHDGGMHVLRKFSEYKEADKFGKIIIKNNVFIGIRSIILPNVTIGNNVIIGAGSIVTKPIPDNSVAAGVPCKIICSLEEYIEKSKMNIYSTKKLLPAEKKEFLKGKLL